MNGSTAIVGSPELAALVHRQRAYFASGTTWPLQFRREALQRLRQGLVAGEESLLAALHADLRKPPQEAYVAEIGMVLSEIDYAIKHLRQWMKPRRRSTPWMIWPSHARLVPRPLGLTLLIGPWNYPVQLLLLPLIGAIAAGNCAIVKPSEMSPRTSEAIATLIGQTFAAEHVACVQGDRGVAEALLNERFDKIFFTGSGVAGRAVAAAAAKNLTPVTLELGGKCPVIVCADANLAVAARRIIWAKTMNAGQTCVAPDYLLVHQSVRGRLIEAMVSALHQMFGPDVQNCLHYGRIVNARHLERLRGYLQEGTVVAGGQCDPVDLYLAPTLLDNIPAGAKVLDEEVFGPVLPIVPFDDFSQVLEFVGRRPVPLAVYLFTADHPSIRQVERQIPCGGLCVNDLMVQLFGKELPFGGLGESGMGSYHGKASFDCFTHYQGVVKCSTAIDLPFRYPPPRLSMRRFRQVLPWLLRG